ncbi:MAG: class I SAM-dependent methyltransferase [SAR324 cluster bacterium]|uniref:Class I SAM-dependent methyltransferase n=1 Tax=SAR324 cluster bacterium TaxID=2024889 RepID=A0A7X9FSJ2_9DELT|nr:class I SAM-dependent methyltransferase [SAR324 cluster bacterium]
MLKSMDISELVSIGNSFSEKLKILKASIHPEPAWYPYDTMANLIHLEQILCQPYRDLLELADNLPVLDIGCADGELGFLFESLGYSVHFIDYAPTNFNGLDGLETLHAALKSKAVIDNLDIDSQFHLEKKYGLTICLGLLYHIKNPFFLLSELARVSNYCLVSTKVFRKALEPPLELKELPIAYLLDPQEANNDPTNFWIFTECGLKRLLNRSGFELLCYGTVGCQEDSDPSSHDRDERAFCLLKRKPIEIEKTHSLQNL